MQVTLLHTISSDRQTISGLPPFVAGIQDVDSFNHREAIQARRLSVEASMSFTALEYSQPNLVDVLQETNKQLQRIDLEYQQIDQALQNIDQQLQIGIAHNYNYSIVRCNSLYAQSSQSLMPLQKTVPGCGHATAQLIANAKARQTLKNRFRAGEDPSEIGSTPPNFNPKVEHYQHIDILEMVVFYNESFGITAGDTLSNRIMKFKRFLTEL